MISAVIHCVAICRPSPNTPSGRGVMSISCLSFGVVRVEEPGSITSLTLQDVGMVMPGGMCVCVRERERERERDQLLLVSSSARIVVVKITGPSVLCRSDEVGEICVQSASTGSGFWGLPGKTSHVFQVRENTGERCMENT